jgi:hypothetical protein
MLWPAGCFLIKAGGQRIDFLSQKIWIWIRIHLKARIRIQWIWIRNSGISPVYFYHHICGETALWFMFKILVWSLCYKIFLILRFLHQQDFIAFNIAQVVTFCSKKATRKINQTKAFIFLKKGVSISTISPKIGRTVIFYNLLFERQWAPYLICARLFLKSTLFNTASSAAP